MGEDELPPVVAPFLADISKLIRGIEMAKEAVKSFDKEEGTATADVNTDPGMSKLLGLEEALAAFNADHATATANVDVAPALAGIDAVNTALDALSARQAAVALGVSPSSIYSALNRGDLGGYKVPAPSAWGRDWRWQVPADVVATLRNSGRSPSELQALLTGGGAGLAGALAGETVTGGGSGGGGGGGLLGMLGGFFGGGGARGGGGAGAGLMAALGFGAAGIPGLGGLAGFGTLGGLLGFGAEHALFTGLGVGGSAMGGLLGGGLLGMGALGVAGVGMGTDMAGLGQAANDIKGVVAAQNQLSQAIAVYGQNSYQAAAAANNLNYVLSDFSPVARGAILQAANMVQQFKVLFDQFTGPAEKIGAQIISGGIGVGEKFLPTVGKFAATNMGIIQKSLTGKGGLYGWMGGQGLAIFTDLEKEFTTHLPTAMHAFTQALELVIKTIDIASHYTGGFLSKIDAFVTKWNGVDFNRWAGEIGKLIGVFRIWLGFFIQIAKTVWDIFQPAVGAGSAVIKMLTGVLKNLDAWLTSSKMKAELHALFSVHLKELIGGIGGLIKGLLPIAEQFMGVFIRWSTQGAGMMTLILKPLDQFVSLISHNPVASELLGWALMLGLVYSKMGPLLALVKAMGVAWGRTGAAAVAGGSAFRTATAEETGAIGPLAAGTDVGAAYAGTRFAGLKAAAGTGAVYAQGALATAGMGLMGAIGGSAVAGATETNKNQHMRLSRDLTTGGMGLMGAGLGMMQINPLAGGIMMGVGGLVAAAGEIVNHWKGISKFFADDVWHPIRGAALDAWHTVDNDVVHPFERAPGEIASAFSSGFGAVKRAVVGVWHTIDNDVIHPIERAPGDVASAFKAGFGALESFFEALPGRLLGELRVLPEQLAALAGSAIGYMVRGFADGVILVWKFFTQLVPHVLGVLASWGGQMFHLGVTVLTAMWKGIVSAAEAVWKFWTQVVPRVLGILASWAGEMFKLGLTVLRDLWHGLVVAGEAVWAFFRALPGRVFGFVTGMPHTMNTTGRSWLSALWHGLVVAGKAVWAFFKALPGTIWGFISKIPSAMFNFGRTIISDMIRGIESMAGSFAGAFKNAVGGALSHVPLIGGLFHNAMGTSSFQGGLTWVGERGPELMRLPRSTAIYSNGMSRAMAGTTNTTNASHVEVNVMVPPGAPAAEIGHEVAWQVAKLAPGGR